MTRRNTELMLLCIAAPLVILLFAMVALNEGNRVTLDNLTVPLSMFVTFVVAHLAIRKLAPGADPAILPLSFALSGIGIAFITRLAPDLAMKQVGWLFLGVVCHGARLGVREESRQAWQLQIHHYDRRHPAADVAHASSYR